jgi:hypothetical protein
VLCRQAPPSTVTLIFRIPVAQNGSERSVRNIVSDVTQHRTQKLTTYNVVTKCRMLYVTAHVCKLIHPSFMLGLLCAFSARTPLPNLHHFSHFSLLPSDKFIYLCLSTVFCPAYKCHDDRHKWGRKKQRQIITAIISSEVKSMICG